MRQITVLIKDKHYIGKFIFYLVSYTNLGEEVVFISIGISMVTATVVLRISLTLTESEVKYFTSI